MLAPLRFWNHGQRGIALIHTERPVTDGPKTGKLEAALHGGMLRFAVVAWLAMAAGCSADFWRGPGFADRDGNEMQKMRSKEETIDQFGFSNKARQIERELGAQ